MAFCQFKEKGGGMVVINVAAVRMLSGERYFDTDMTKIAFDLTHSIIVTEDIKAVAKKLADA